MFKKFLISIIFFIFITSCNSIRPAYIKNSPYSNVTRREISIYVDKNFGESDKVYIANAVDQWNYALNGHIILQIVSYNFDVNIDNINKNILDDAFIIKKIYANNPLVKDAPGKMTLAWVDCIGGHYMWIIRDRFDNQQMQGIVMHEFGHMLGAKHVNKPSLMLPIYNAETYKCIDSETMYSVAQYNNLQFEDLNYCLY